MLGSLFRINQKDFFVDTKTEVWPNGIPSVGQKARRSRLISNRDIELFTEISGDKNPLHYDEEIARNSRFQGIVVQGGVTSAILNAVVARFTWAWHRVLTSELELQGARSSG